MKIAIGLYDVVELRVDTGRWGAGTVGTVVEALPMGVVVEIADDRGHTLDMLSLPYAAVAPGGASDPDQLRFATG